MKRALAVTPLKFGISFNFTAFNQAGALVHVYKDGSVLINHGGTEMGQGLHTKMLQVAATSLGIPLERVRLAPTRTDKVPNTSATAASSSADLNGGAVKDACEQVLGRLREVDAGRGLAWDELVREAYFSRVQLWAAGFYRTEGIHWDSTAMQGHPFKYFAYGVAAAEVEVDGFTGAYTTRRVDIVQDVGDSLSPLVDIGQVEGGFVQGVGWLTLEDLRWDETDGPGRGRLTTQSASTYKLPSLGELPDELHVALLEHAHEDGVVYGSKAVGEPPLMLAFAVREALREAAAAFGPRRAPASSCASPATPEAVFWAVGAGADVRPRPRGRRAAGRRPRPARPERAGPAPDLRAERDVHWLTAVRRLRDEREAGVLVTVADVRGHAPRDAGAKMVVAEARTWGSVGGGNLEETAVARARAMLAAGVVVPEQLDGRAERQGAHRPRPPVLRGRGHPAPRAAAGRALGRGLRRGSRRAGAGPGPGRPRPRPAPRRLARRPAGRRPAGARAGGEARVEVHRAPVPELALGVGAARHPRPRDDPRPRRGLRALRRRAAVHAPRHDRPDRVLREVGPVPHRPRRRGPRRGDHRPDPLPDRAARPGRGKEPATIAVSVAAELLELFAADRARAVR